MCTTVTRMTAVLALIAVIAASAIAALLTVGTAADACAARSQIYAEKIGSLTSQNRNAMTIIDRDCLDWRPAGSPPRTDWVSPF